MAIGLKEVSVQKNSENFFKKVLTATQFNSSQHKSDKAQNCSSIGSQGCLSFVIHQRDIIISLMIMKTQKNRQNPKKSVERCKKVSKPFLSMID